MTLQQSTITTGCHSRNNIIFKVSNFQSTNVIQNWDEFLDPKINLNHEFIFGNIVSISIAQQLDLISTLRFYQNPKLKRIWD